MNLSQIGCTLQTWTRVASTCARLVEKDLEIVPLAQLLRAAEGRNGSMRDRIDRVRHLPQQHAIPVDANQAAHDVHTHAHLLAQGRLHDMTHETHENKRKS